MEVPILNSSRCFEVHENTTVGDNYCTPAWDSLYCWPPTNAGAMASQLCSNIFTFLQEDLVVEKAAAARAYRVCTEDGEWLWGNWTNYSECIPFLEADVLIPLAVGYILLICSSISLLTLSITLFVFWYFTSLHCTRLKVHRNLVAAMIINAIVLIIVASYLIFGEHFPLKYEHDLLCRAMLSLKMYTSMSSINWMFIEGLVLHSRITISIFKQDAPFKIYYFIGWGLPASVTIIWSWLMYQELSSPCWQGYGNSPYIWVIVGPMMAALIVNTLFLVNILRILITRNKANASEETTQVKKAVKATGLLFPLLGITNLMFCINPRDESYLEDAYMIINALLQSSQGILVSVLYCFANSDVQKVLRNSYHKRATKRNSLFHPPRSRGLSQTSTTYLGHSDVTVELTKKFVVCGKPVLVPLRDCVIPPPNKPDIITTHVF